MGLNSLLRYIFVLILFLFDISLKYYFFSKNNFTINTGISFGAFQNSNGFFILLTIILLVLLISYSILKRKVDIGILLLLFGGISNLIDRIVYGGVVDYINFFNLFHNNIGDIMIFCGMVWLVYSNFITRHV